MKYEEAKKQATLGPFRVEQDPDDPIVPDIVGPEHDPDDMSMQFIATVYGGLDEHDMQKEANAALLAHCFNHFDELLEALKEYRNTISAHHGLPGTGLKVAKLIARCEEVEMP